MAHEVDGEPKICSYKIKYANYGEKAKSGWFMSESYLNGSKASNYEAGLLDLREASPERVSMILNRQSSLNFRL